MKEIINDFNTQQGTNLSPTKIKTYQKVMHRFLKSTDKPKIDLVLVVDQLSTGFDARRINTVYLLKSSMPEHQLFQTISRTNRVFNTDKQHGVIINYSSSLDQTIKNAITTYGGEEISDGNVMVVDKYDK